MRESDFAVGTPVPFHKDCLGCAHMQHCLYDPAGDFVGELCMRGQMRRAAREKAIREASEARRAADADLRGIPPPTPYSLMNPVGAHMSSLPGPQPVARISLKKRLATVWSALLRGAA